MDKEIKKIEKKKKYNSTVRSRCWCFTSFAEVFPVVPDLELVRFYTYQQEKTKEGKLHFQGVVQFKDKHSMAQAQRIMGLFGAHMEVCIDLGASILYCNKAESRVAVGATYGVPCSQGQRTDWRHLQIMCKEQKSVMDIAESFPNLVGMCPRGVQNLKSLYEKVPNWTKVEVFIFWGATGVGKTRRCYDLAPDLFKLSPPSSNGMVWWDGYYGQSTLLLDDFYGWIKRHVMLELLDGYPMTLQIKGGTVQKRWTRVFITSNKDPDRWYKEWEVSGMDDAFNRRITKIENLK